MAKGTKKCADEKPKDGAKKGKNAFMPFVKAPKKK